MKYRGLLDFSDGKLFTGGLIPQILKLVSRIRFRIAAKVVVQEFSWFSASHCILKGDPLGRYRSPLVVALWIFAYTASYKPLLHMWFVCNLGTLWRVFDFPSIRKPWERFGKETNMQKILFETAGSCWWFSIEKMMVSLTSSLPQVTAPKHQCLAGKSARWWHFDPDSQWRILETSDAGNWKNEVWNTKEESPNIVGVQDRGREKIKYIGIYIYIYSRWSHTFDTVEGSDILLTS